MTYLIVKIHTNNAIEYGKVFDNEIDAIRESAKLNEVAKENGFDVHFMVLPCVVMPKVKAG